MKFSNIFIALGIAGVIVGVALLITQGVPSQIIRGLSIVSTDVIGRDLPSEFDPSPKPYFGPLDEYIQIFDSCGPYYGGSCVHARSGPGENYPVVRQLRNGIVLKTVEKIAGDEHDWYKVTFDEPLLYPSRVNAPWYVAADYAQPFFSRETYLTKGNATSTKIIYINRSTQMLSAYDGDTLFMKQAISTGIDPTPTPRGTFTIFKKTPSRYMQGPLPGFSMEDEFDLPGVPWDLYFTAQGAAIHGAYWHDAFGKEHSHGCVNLPLAEAKRLYDWATVGTKVVVKD